MKTLERRLGLIVASAFILSTLIVGGAVAYTHHVAVAQPTTQPTTAGFWDWIMNPDKGHGNTKVA